ncbi:MAG TPA: hypothetical protein PKZ69_02335 [Candidatus Cloacimonadota bacterium]|nr:hypothetical protein [Candidatus Cloacimonadota bacterium]
MIKLNVTYKNQTKEVTLYNEWDIKQDEVVDRDFITMDDQKGKYLLYDDGWNLYTRINGKTIKAFSVGTGLVKRYDYTSFSRIHLPHTNYSGARSYDEHPICRPYRRAEYLAAGTFLKTNRRVKLTPRIRFLIKEKMVEALKKRGITEEFIVDRLIREVDNMRGRGADRLEALAMLSRTAGIELERSAMPQTTMNQPLFQQFNISGGTIQDQRRKIPTRNELIEEKKFLNVVDLTDSEVNDFLDAHQKGDRFTFNEKTFKNSTKVTDDNAD